MSEQAAPAKIFGGINIPKVLAGALAAVTVAVLGSFLGVAGTLAGAAIASVVGSVGTEIYERSLKHGAKKLQTVVAPTFVKAPAAMGTPEVAAAHEEDSPSHTVAESQTRQRQIRWGRVAAAAIGVFVIAMGAITAFEFISGETVAGAVGATSNTSGTTLFGGSTSKSSDKTPATSPSSTPTDQPTTGSSADPQVQATTPSPQASTPADNGATTAPTTDAPTQTTDPGTGADSGDGSDSGTGTGNGSTGDGRLTSPGSGGGAGNAGQTTQGSGS